MSTPKISAVLALDGEKEYKSAITSINAAQRELRSEMKLATEQFSGQQNTIEALTKKHEILTEQHTLQASKVELCEAAVKKYNTTQQELSSRVDAAEEKLKQEQETLVTLKSSTEATTEEIEEQEKAVEEAKATLKDANADYENACKKQNEWQTSLNNAQASLNQTDQALKENSQYLDEAKNSADGCATSIDAFGKRTQEAGEEAEKFGETSVSSITQLNAALQASDIPDKIKEVGNALLDCVDAAAAFETSMAKVSTLVDTSTTSMSDMSAEVLAVSSELGVSATEIAEATYQAISAGQSTENAVSMVGTATKLSIGGFTDSATAVDILTTALNAYGLEAEDAENISNILITTQNLGKTTVSELASTMGRVIPLASAYNVEMDNLASAYAIMTANGIATAETTTYLKSMLNELGDSSSDVATILQNETGMSFSELSEAGYSLGDVMDILGTSVDNDATAFSNLWSSSEAGIGALSLLNSGSAKYNSTLKSMQNSAGATESAYESMADTTEMAQQRMEVAAENLKIAIGDELTSAMEKLYDTGGDVLEFLEDFAEENPTVVKLLASLTAGMVAFAGATTVATIAAEAFKVIQTLVNPTTLLVTALVGLTSAAVVFNATLETEQTELQKTNTASKDMAKSLKELNDSYATSSASRKASTDSLSAQSTVCKDLVAQLEALQEKTALTADEQYQQQAIVDQLNTLMPELGLTIDENTGKTNLSTEAIEANVEALLKQAEAEAYTEIAADITKELTEAKIELAEAETQLGEQQEQTRAATEAYNEAISNASGDERDYMFAIEEAKNAMEESEKAEKTLQEAYDEASDTVAALEEEYSTYQDCLADVYAQEAAAKATTELGDAAEETSDKISSMSETAQEAYSEMYESLSDTISSQMDLFDEFNGEAELKTSELLSNMQSQVDGITEWSENLEELAERGIDEGLLQKLADMGPEGASYVSTFAQMTNDELEEANKLWAESLTVTDEAAERVATAYAELGETAAESYTTSLIETVEDPMEEIAERLTTSGTMLPEGVAVGIEDNSSVAELAAQNLAENILTAFDSTAQIESPSKKTEESGKNLVLGLQQGLNNNKKLATNAMTTVAKEVVTEAQTQMSYSVSYNIGLQFDQGLAAGIRAGKSEVINAAIEVAVAAVEAAKNKLEINSPSKVTEELGGYYMEGWVEGIQAKTENLKDAVEGSLDTALIPDKSSALSAVAGTDAIGGAETSGTGDTINIYFQPKSMDESELDKAFDYVNERFGKAL